MELPEEFVKVIPEIAENIDAGFICFLNLDTREIEDIPKHMVLNPEDFERMTGESAEENDFKYLSWENYVTFEPLGSHESFQIMEGFAEDLADSKLQGQLFNALNNRKPFSNFKRKVDDSPYRQNWFDYKQKWLENHVREELYRELKQTEEK
ncbi:MAG: hypothetical protein J7L95_07915 [Prolixibacteraceae bacterium]|nr:hypothetical protein [Prolixibacteraceae bacterium]